MSHKWYEIRRRASAIALAALGEAIFVSFDPVVAAIPAAAAFAFAAVALGRPDGRQIERA